MASFQSQAEQETVSCYLPKLIAQSIKHKDENPQRAAIVDAGLELIELLLQKNTDYGSSVFEAPILAFGCQAGIAIRVRMSDKLKRIIQLSTNPQQVKGESIEDSLRDLVGYYILDKALEKLESNRG